MKNVFAGDSMTDTRPSIDGFLNAYWPQWLALMRREHEIVNLARGGFGVADEADLIFARPPAVGERYFIFLGTVDHVYRGAGSGALALYELALSALISWWTTNKLLINSPGWVLIGPWQDFGNAWGFPKYVSPIGSTASAVFSGDVCEVAYIASDSNGAGEFSVAIDGVRKGTFTCGAPATVQTSVSTRYYAPALLRFAGCGPGPHTVGITKTAGPGIPLFLLWLGQGSNSLPLYVLTLPNNQVPAIQTRVDAMNASIRTVVKAARAAGLNVTLVDAGPQVDPWNDVQTGGDVHIVQSGHIKYAILANAAIP